MPADQLVATAEAIERIEQFAQELVALCNRYRVNLRADLDGVDVGIEDRDRHRGDPKFAKEWPSDAFVAGVDAKGCYHTANGQRVKGVLLATWDGDRREL